MYWVDSRASMPKRGPVTHALVVGVSAYRYLPAREDGPSTDPLTFGLVQLSTPATAAFRFARWLRDSYRHPTAALATIRLLLSASASERRADPELDRTCADVPAADRDQVRAAILAWCEDNRGNPDGLSVCYLAGHGISLSYVDSYVLLQDFARDHLVLDYSVDVGSMYRGMNGPSMPQTQFYFVDACRTRPEAFSRYRNAGSGVGLVETWAGADRRAAPIYFSTSPDTSAYGTPDAGGTLFSTALLESLAGPGVDTQVDAEGYFVVTNSSLQCALEDRVDQLARRSGQSQYVTVGGQSRQCVLHRFAQPPEFPFSVLLDPDRARPVARAHVWDGDRQRCLLSNRQFDDNPMSWRLPAGLHTLDVTIDAPAGPYRPRIGLPLLVQAKQNPKPRRVNVDAAVAG